MEERKLILNDGTEIEGGHAGISSRGNLWMWFTGYTMAQAVMMFLDPEKTERIVFMAGETEEVYEGYTEMTSINVDANGQFHVGMKRED
jgi:hypothetical protein